MLRDDKIKIKKQKINLFLSVLICTLIFSATVETSFACTTIIVGKGKTADGSVMLAHSEELGETPHHLVFVPRKTHSKNDKYMGYSGARIPQPKITYAYIASTIFDKDYYPGDFTTGINEFQVSVANNMSIMRGVSEDEGAEMVEGGIIWTEFTQLVLERCKTAEEGVKLIGYLCEKYHLSFDSGTMFGVADPSEGWFVEVARDGQWIAQRVPDNGSDMRANSYRISSVELDSPNVLHSKNLIKYATNKGWYDSNSNEFNFAKVYGDPSNQKDSSNTLRHKLVGEMLKSEKKIATKDLFKILRTAYEGTKYYEEDEETGSPFETDIRTISCLETDITCVAQLRSWLPAEIGGCIWWSLSNSKVSSYVPWYYGATSFPDSFTKGTDDSKKGSAYWAFDALKKYVNNNYSRTIKIVNNTWSPIEEKELSEQGAIEAKALGIYKSEGSSAAAKYLNDYSNTQGEKVYKMSGKLLKKLKAEK